MAAFLEGLTILCLGIQLYHYAGYPLLLGLLSRLKPARVVGGATVHAPRVSMVICAYNEAGVIASKVENCRALDPAPDEIVIVDDGSTDGTAEVATVAIRAEGGAEGRIRVVTKQDRGGKSAAMNYGANLTTGDILLFSDASEHYEREAIRWLVEEFADESVAVVSGSHRVKPPTLSEAGYLVGATEGLYWRYEDFIRRKESALGATVASVGSMLAVRRPDWLGLPAGTVNDDAWLTMTALARGRNVRFAHRAIGWEKANETSRDEHVRRRRIAAGRVLLILRSEVWPWRRPAVLGAFLSHKVLRLGLPVLMIGGGLANLGAVILNPDHTVFVVLLGLQLGAAALAVLGRIGEGLGRKWKLPHLAYHLVQSNLMVLLAILDVIGGRSFLKWDKPDR
jgi:poly-beta-1,6-N-acetyl-D-glucosamine synthase